MNSNFALNQDVAMEVKKLLDNIDGIIVNFDLFASIVENQV